MLMVNSLVLFLSFTINFIPFDKEPVEKFLAGISFVGKRVSIDEFQKQYKTKDERRGGENVANILQIESASRSNSYSYGTERQ